MCVPSNNFNRGPSIHTFPAELRAKEREREREREREKRPETHQAAAYKNKDSGVCFWGGPRRESLILGSVCEEGKCGKWAWLNRHEEYIYVSHMG